MKKLLPLLMVSLCLLTACATDSLSSLVPQSPKVALSSVNPTKLGLTGQQFAFTLGVSNPNQFRLPIAATDFVAKFNGQEVAKGISAKQVTLPANGVSNIVLNIDTNLLSSMKGIWGQLASGKLNMDYELSGAMKVDFGIAPFSVPYTVKGNLLDSVPFVGKGQ